MPKKDPSKPQQPNIVFIMGDDIGWFNVGAYHRGIMAGRTPNIDRMATEGMLFTDYYAEASCTAGRAQFITGQHPVRTGLTTVGQAGAGHRHAGPGAHHRHRPAGAGYATGQFGKNHVGDRNEFLPTLHGFEEFFGYLYHLDAMEDPFHPNYPKHLRDQVGPRNMLHCWAEDVDDPHEEPRWGKVGKQRIEDAGELDPKRMETVDDEILEHTFKFIDKAQADGKPFFIWLNPTRMHVVTHLSEKYEKMRNSDNGWSVQEAGMAQLDDIVGAVMQKLKDLGLDQDTILVFTTDNGAEKLHLARRRPDPLRGGQGHGARGRLPRALRAALARQGAGGQGRERLDVRPRLVPHLPGRRGNPNIVEELKKGKKLGDRSYKVHLDGYNQLDLITGKGPSQRNEIYYFAESTLGAVRIGDFKYRFIDQPSGWLGGTVKVDWPMLTNIRLDPFERSGLTGSFENFNWFAYEFWRFVFVQQEVARFAESFVQFPPMQPGATFNLDAVKEQVKKAMQSHAGA
jgi:arylsulfatase